MSPTERFIDRLLSPTGYKNVQQFRRWTDEATGKPQTAMWGQAFSDSASAARYALHAAQSGRDVYITMSTAKVAVQKEKNGHAYMTAARKAVNVDRFRGLWADIDMKPSTYASVEEALETIIALAPQGLPMPTFIVSSGNGLHLHWVFEQDMDLGTWSWMSKALVAFLLHHGLKFDTQCTVDSVRVLRVPGTFNWKDPERPKSVSLVYEDEFVDRAAMEACLQAFAGKGPATPTSPGADVLALPPRQTAQPAKPLGDLTAGVQDGQKISLAAVLPNCEVLRHSFETNGAEDLEPLWREVLRAVSFDQNAGQLAHEVSRGHPGYSAEETEKKLAQVVAEQAKYGWPKCTQFANASPDSAKRCASCRLRDKGKSPLNFRSTPGAIPFPYVVKDERVYLQIEEEGGLVIDKLAFPAKPLKAGLYDHPIEGRVFAVHFVDPATHRNRVVDLPVSELNSAGEAFGKRLGRVGIGMDVNIQRTARGFLMAWLEKIQVEEGLDAHDPPFGWVHDKGRLRGFSFGGKLHMPNGVEGDVMDTGLRDIYKVTGDLQAWRKAAQLVLDEKRMDLAMIVAAGCGAPLMKLTGQPSVVLSFYSKKSGLGKSAAMRVAQAIWGSPRHAMGMLSDTANSTLHVLGQIRSLPMFWDEIKSSKDVEAFVGLAMQLTLGREKRRLSADVQLKISGEWDSMLIVGSNESVVDLITAADETSFAGVNRVVEVEVQPRKGEPPVPMYEAAQVFAELDHHFGLVGVELARAYVKHYDELQELVNELLKSLTDDTHASAEERFWVAGMAASLAGASLANDLGFTDFDLARLYKFAVSAIRRMRLRRVEEVTDMTQSESVAALITRYLQELDRSNQLLVTDKIRHGNARSPEIVVLNSKPDLLSIPRAQYAMQEGVIQLDRAEFRRWLTKTGTKKAGIFETLTEVFKLSELRTQLGRGTAHRTPMQAALYQITLPESVRGDLSEVVDTMEGGE